MEEIQETLASWTYQKALPKPPVSAKSVSGTNFYWNQI